MGFVSDLTVRLTRNWTEVHSVRFAWMLDSLAAGLGVGINSAG